MHDTYLPSCRDCAARARKWTEDAVKFDEIQLGTMLSPRSFPVPRHFLNVKNCLRAPACYFIEFVPWHSRRNNNVTKKREREGEREEENAGGRRNAARVRCFSEDTGIFEDIWEKFECNGSNKRTFAPVSFTDFPVAKLCDRTMRQTFLIVVWIRSTRIDDTFAVFLRSYRSSVVRATGVNRLRIFPKILSYYWLVTFSNNRIYGHYLFLFKFRISNAFLTRKRLRQDRFWITSLYILHSILKKKFKSNRGEETL